jgi:hypothetical protein
LIEEYVCTVLLDESSEPRAAELDDWTKARSIRYSHENPLASQFSQRGLRSSPSSRYVSDVVSSRTRMPVLRSRGPKPTFSTPFAACQATSADSLLA